ncbi:MAG TPA: serine/threonine-protein kinase [Pirellulales bacterium]|jgi:hypothetical protein
MDLPVAQQPRLPEKPPASTRFQFATGDRPLSGYTIKRGVGRGGFGEVYFAVSDGGKEVALKLVRRNLDVELRGVQHCLNLKHPNLIALYDIRRDGEDDDCWIVMEYVAGESLEGAIRRHPNGMPADEAVDWLRGIAAGASYLHSHGIVHRDLKPGNVFREDSVVKLGDYGLSKFISCSRRSGQTESVGTVHYMAPEIAHGRYGREIDIYALGVILYEMLTGRVPFDGESVGEVLMKHLTAQPDVGLLPAAYRQVVARALAKDPAVRFSSIEQFMAALPSGGPGSAAAPNGPAATAAEPASPRTGNSAAARVAPPARPAALDRALAEFLWALGIAFLLVAIETARGESTPLGWVALALVGGLAIYFRRARRKASQLPGNQNWPATSDVPPPLPPMPAGRSPGAGPWMAHPSPLDWLAGLHPLAVGIIGAVLAPMALGLLLAMGRFPGNPSSLARIGLSLLAGFSAYSWAKNRARQRSGNQPQATSAAVRPSAAATAPPASAFENAANRVGRAVGLEPERALPALVVKGARERLAELLGSLLVSAAVATVLAVIAAAWQRGESGVEEVAWFALTGTLGAWAVLALSKLWAGTRGEPFLRRFAMLVVGLGLGASSFALDRLLMIRLPFSQSLRPSRWHIDWDFYNRLDGAPHLEAYLAYFGLMFFLVPWWRQADPLRPSRVRVGSLAWTLFVALLLNLICPFPQPWGAIVATIISLAVQLASPPAAKANRLASGGRNG